MNGHVIYWMGLFVFNLASTVIAAVRGDEAVALTGVVMALLSLVIASVMYEDEE